MIQLSHPYMTTGKTIALIEDTDWKGSLHEAGVYKACAGDHESKAMYVVRCGPQSVRGWNGLLVFVLRAKENYWFALSNEHDGMMRCIFWKDHSCCSVETELEMLGGRDSFPGWQMQFSGGNIAGSLLWGKAREMRRRKWFWGLKMSLALETLILRCL